MRLSCVQSVEVPVSLKNSGEFLWESTSVLYEHVGSTTECDAAANHPKQEDAVGEDAEGDHDIDHCCDGIDDFLKDVNVESFLGIVIVDMEAVAQPAEVSLGVYVLLELVMGRYCVLKNRDEEPCDCDESCRCCGEAEKSSGEVTKYDH